MFTKPLPLRPPEEFRPDYRQARTLNMHQKNMLSGKQAKHRFFDENKSYDSSETAANTVNYEILKIKDIPTIREMHEPNYPETKEDYLKYIKKPKVKESRKLAAVNEFFIGLSYMPFYRNPYLLYNTPKV